MHPRRTRSPTAVSTLSPPTTTTAHSTAPPPHKRPRSSFDHSRPTSPPSALPSNSCRPQRANTQRLLPLAIWFETFQYLQLYEVGHLMHECSSFLQAGTYRFKQPLQIPGDCSTVALALQQIHTLRHQPQPVRVTKIVLGPGDYQLPKVDQRWGATHQLVIDMDDIEISGTAAAAAARTSTTPLKPLPPFQDVVLQHSPTTHDDVAPGAPLRSVLDTRITGQLVVAGGASNVTLTLLDLHCVDDTAVIVKEKSTCTVQQCHVHNAGNSGLEAREQSHLVVDQCVVSENNSDGIFAEHVGTTVVVQRCHLLHNYDGVWSRKKR